MVRTYLKTAAYSKKRETYTEYHILYIAGLTKRQKSNSPLLRGPGVVIVQGVQVVVLVVPRERRVLHAEVQPAIAIQRTTKKKRIFQSHGGWVEADAPPAAPCGTSPVSPKKKKHKQRLRLSTDEPGQFLSPRPYPPKRPPILPRTRNRRTHANNVERLRRRGGGGVATGYGEREQSKATHAHPQTRENKTRPFTTSPTPTYRS